jgi:hypothetical protein
MNHCPHKGMPGIQRWVVLGVIGDNLVNIGYALAPSVERWFARTGCLESVQTEPLCLSNEPQRANTYAGA